MIEWEAVEAMVQTWLDVINYTFDTAIKALTISPFETTASVMEKAMSAVEGVALVLVSLFFVMQLCSDAMLLKIQSYEQVFKLFFKFILAKVLVQNSRGIMGIIFNGFNDIAEDLTGDFTGFLDTFGTDSIIEKPESAGFMNINYILKLQEATPSYWILLGSCLVIYLVLLGRLFEIVVYTVIAPIPLSTFAGEGWHEIAKSFIKSYAAVCLQGIIVVIMFYAFTQIAEVLGGTSTMGITVTALSLALGVMKSGQWSRQALGV